MFLSAIEYAIPKPLPFLRLGLANLPIILAVKQFSFKEYSVLVLLKVFTQAMISGTLLSYVFVFSISGTVASSMVMWILWKLLKTKYISNVGLSVSGALANVEVQIWLCYLMMFGSNTRYIVVLLLSFGSVSGLILGLFSNIFENKSVFVRNINQEEKFENDIGEYNENSFPVDKTELTNDRMYITPVLGLLLMVSICFVESCIVRWILVISSFVMNCIIKKGKVKIFPSIIILFSIVIMNLFQPNGRLLISCGNLRITENALISGLNKSGKLIGMVFSSQIIFSKRIYLPGLAGIMLGKVIQCFNVLTSKRISFKKKNVFVVLDDWIGKSWDEYSRNDKLTIGC